jgi:hypothetical protein
MNIFGPVELRAGVDKLPNVFNDVVGSLYNIVRSDGNIDYGFLADGTVVYGKTVEEIPGGVSNGFFVEREYDFGVPTDNHPLGHFKEMGFRVIDKGDRMIGGKPVPVDRVDMKASFPVGYDWPNGQAEGLYCDFENLRQLELDVLKLVSRGKFSHMYIGFLNPVDGRDHYEVTADLEEDPSNVGQLILDFGRRDVDGLENVPYVEIKGKHPSGVELEIQTGKVLQVTKRLPGVLKYHIKFLETLQEVVKEMDGLENKE